MGYGYGSVYQRASDGRWLAAVELPRRPGEPRRRAHRSGRTREEAEMRLAAYRADHPAFEVEITGNRATKLLHARALGTHTPKEWWALVRSVGCACAYCGVKTSIFNMEQDHIIPVCRGGSDAIDNLALACRSCNQEKHRMTGDEFRAWKASR
jgi:5-methylcytosine-specific restriction endonuclease McrA